MNKKILVILFGIIFSQCASAFPRPSNWNIIGVRVISDDGTEFRQYKTFPNICSQGNYYYVEAFKGEKYSIEVTNRSNRRIGVVIAVDGRNIISGEKSYLNNRERMYIIEPYSTNTYEGWRTGMERVNRFYFTGQSDSYAEKVFADASAMGTIALAAYCEKLPEPVRISPSLNSGSRSQGAKENRRFEARDKSSESEQAGTGFGETIYSPVRIIYFDPENTISQKIVLKYEWRKQLCTRGVINCGSINRLWPSETGFAPLPSDFGAN